MVVEYWRVNCWLLTSTDFALNARIFTPFDTKCSANFKDLKSTFVNASYSDMKIWNNKMKIAIFIRVIGLHPLHITLPYIVLNKSKSRSRNEPWFYENCFRITNNKGGKYGFDLHNYFMLYTKVLVQTGITIPNCMHFPLFFLKNSIIY